MRNFQHTIDVLVKAYMNGTLSHGICGSCAVGNMVSVSCKSHLPYNDIIRGWGSVFCTDPTTLRQRIKPGNYNGYAKDEIDSTGYSWRELSQIEWAFESCEKSDDKDQYMFNGLMAVVEVLADIHGISLEAKEETKKLFVKA